MEKSRPRDCVDLLFVREICCPIVTNISRTHGGWCFFWLLLEMSRNETFRQIEIDTYISMVWNHCKNLLEETFRCAILLRVLNITALLARLAQTITKIYKNKILWFVFPKKKIIIILLACSTHIIDCTKLGDFSLPLTKGSPFSDLTGQRFQTIYYLSKK